MYNFSVDDEEEQNKNEQLKKQKVRRIMPWRVRDFLPLFTVIILVVIGTMIYTSLTNSWSRGVHTEEDTGIVTQTQTTPPFNQNVQLTEKAPLPSPTVLKTPIHVNPELSHTPAGSYILPATVYLIAHNSGSDQVWRLEQDGKTMTQITFEKEAVTDLDISPDDGRLAYVSGNKLILARSDGSERRVLVSGEAVVPGSTEWTWTKEISHLLWSSDGIFLAYGLNGINIMTVENENIKTLIQNVIPTKIGKDKPKIYYPILWSPHDSLLFTNVSDSENQSLIVLSVQDGTSKELPGVQACCQLSISNDLHSVFIGSGRDIDRDMGLWRYDMYSDEVQILIKDDRHKNGGIATIIQYPKQATDGRLVFFYGQSDTLDNAPLSLVGSFLEAINERVLLSSDSFSDIREALWTPDGSSIILLTGSAEYLQLVKPDNKPPLQLSAFGHHLHWGVITPAVSKTP